MKLIFKYYWSILFLALGLFGTILGELRNDVLEGIVGGFFLGLAFYSIIEIKINENY